MNLELEAACKEHVYVCTKWGSRAERREQHMYVYTKLGSRTERRSRPYAPSLTQKQSPIDNYLQMKNYFSPKESYSGNKTLLRVELMPNSRWPTQNVLRSIFRVSPALFGVFVIFWSDCFFIFLFDYYFLDAKCFLERYKMIWICMWGEDGKNWKE